MIKIISQFSILLFILNSSAALLLQRLDEGAGLRAIAERRDFSVGAAVDAGPLRGEPAYGETLAREFNVTVAENAFKFENIHPERDRYDFTEADAIADFAKSKGMKLRGHTLVWHRQLPSWLTAGNYGRDEAIAILREHIATVAGRYRGRIWAWDVVNEAIGDDEKTLRRDSFWYRTIGPDYIKLAFQFAREADPDAILYYNDYGNDGLGGKSDAIFNMVRDLRREGVPVQGVGWQMHLEPGFRIGDQQRKNARRLAELGLEISITELDARVKLPAAPNALSEQASTYREVASFCLTEPNCQALVLWGFTDKHSWIPDAFPGTGQALIYDESYQPKPAYAALKLALETAANLAPEITSARIAGDDLIVTGRNFERGGALFINWRRLKTEPDKGAPGTQLIVKKAARGAPRGQQVWLQVQNGNGKLSPAYRFDFE